MEVSVCCTIEGKPVFYGTFSNYTIVNLYYMGSLRTPVTVVLPISQLLPQFAVPGLAGGRWLKARSAAGAGPATAPPKGVTLFYDPRHGGGAANQPAGKDEKCVVIWPLRLLALRGNGAEVTERVQSALRHEVK